VLVAAIAGVIGMLALNGLPKLYHPVFNVPEFDLASRNRFFICLRHGDRDAARAFLRELKPLGVWDVPR